MAWTYTSPTAAVTAGTTETLTDIPAAAVVGSILVGTTDTQRNIRNLGTNRISVAGTLNISPEYEEIITTGAVSITVPSGGRLNINGQYGDYYSTGKWLHNTNIAGFSPANLLVQNGGQFDWTGGSAFVPGGLQFDATSVVNIKNAVLDSLDFTVGGTATTGEQQIRQSSANLSIDGFTLYRGFFTILAIPQLFKGYKPRFCTQALAFGSATPDVDIPIFGYDTDGSNTKDAVLFAGSRPVLTNAVRGSELNVSHNSLTISLSFAYGLLRVFQKVQVTATAQGTALNAAAYIKDTNNGERRNYASEGFATVPFDGVSDRVYVNAVTSGTSAVFDVLTACVAITAGTATAGDQGRINTGVFRFDYRGKENLPTDKFDVIVWAYAAQSASTEVVLKGEANVVVASAHLPDVNVTLSETAAGELTSISTLDNLYDRAKWHKTRAIQANLEYPTISTQPVNANGPELDLGSRNLVVDATAAAAFVVNTSTHTITVKSTTLAAGTKFTSIKTTGTVSLLNGATLTAALEDANNAGQISIVGVLSADTVEFRKSSDNSVIASRTGPGSFAIAPADVGIQAYFVRLSGSNTVMSTITTPVTLTTGVNPDVPLYAGAEVQVAQAARIELLPTLAQIEASAILAKEATVNTRASQTSVDAIPTNSLLTNDTRLNNLDATVSSRLATSGYTAPPTANDNATAVLTAAQGAPIYADIRKVNDYTVDGTGTEGDPWGPA